MRALLAHVAASLNARALIPSDRRLLVAVSGGLDSTLLLRLLHGLQKPLGLALWVAHANHQLRGRRADADAAWVRALSDSLGCPFVGERLPVRTENSGSTESLEMTSRRLRHAFLARAARSLGISTIAVAHHADDQAELILLRLLRGAGGDGLRGMGWLDPSPADPGVQLIRPLLDLSREQLLQAARDAGFGFREDGSNRDPAFLRNRVRHRLLPLLERQFNPAIRETLRKTADLVGANAAFVNGEARRWLASKRRQPFPALPCALQRSILREQIRSLGHEPGYDLIEHLRASEKPATLSPGQIIFRSADGFVCRASAPPAPEFQSDSARHTLDPKGGAIDFAGRRIEYQAGPRPPAMRVRQTQSNGSEHFSARAVGRVVILRHWRPGDRFQPLGFSKPSKLQDLFINRKVPVARRRSLLVATTAGGTLFWVESLPPGERFKLTDGTRRILRWKCFPQPG